MYSLLLRSWASILQFTTVSSFRVKHELSSVVTYLALKTCVSWTYAGETSTVWWDTTGRKCRTVPCLSGYAPYLLTEIKISHPNNVQSGTKIKAVLQQFLSAIICTDHLRICPLISDQLSTMACIRVHLQPQRFACIRLMSKYFARKFTTWICTIALFVLNNELSSVVTYLALKTCVSWTAPEQGQRRTVGCPSCSVWPEDTRLGIEDVLPNGTLFIWSYAPYLIDWNKDIAIRITYNQLNKN